MNRFLFCISFFLTFAFPCQLFATTQPSRFITMNLPESVLSDALDKILPLQFDTSSDTLEGAITIIEIQDLTLRDQQLFCRLKLKGEDLHLVTKISGHTIRLKVGTIDLHFECNATLRFDTKKQILYVKPMVKDHPSSQESGSNEIGRTLLSLLNGREFPVAMQSIEPLLARASNKTVSIQMKITDIRAIDRALQLSLEPLITTR